MGSTAIWNMTFAGNTLTAWVVALGIMLLAVLALRILTRAIARQVRKLAQGTANALDDLVGDLVEKTNLLFVLVIALWAASYALVLTPRATQALRVLVVFGVLIQAAIWVSAVADHFLSDYRRRMRADDPGVATAMGAVMFLVRVVVWGAVMLIALDTLGVDITTLIAGLGVGGIAVALAVQNVLSDLFASVSIVLDKPFVVGDFIDLGGHMGVVENVGLKTTRVRSLSGEELVVANSDMLSSRIRNYKRMSERRVLFVVGVVYGTPSEKLRQIPQLIRNAVESRDNTRFDRSHFKAFGDSALLFETVYYMTVPDYNSYMDTQQAINLELYQRFEAEEIEFAFPTQTLFVKTETEPAPASATAAS
ncbi:MAG: mechanosensitive ion channel family protein [Gemmatimonadales bacterium]